jgi:hypothetical protein
MEVCIAGKNLGQLSEEFLHVGLHIFFLSDGLHRVFREKQTQQILKKLLDHFWGRTLRTILVSLVNFFDKGVHAQR